MLFAFVTATMVVSLVVVTETAEYLQPQMVMIVPSV